MIPAFWDSMDLLSHITDDELQETFIGDQLEACKGQGSILFSHKDSMDQNSNFTKPNLAFLPLPYSYCFLKCLPCLIITYATNHSLKAPPTTSVTDTSGLPECQRVWVLILIHFVTTSWYLCWCLRDQGHGLVRTSKNSKQGQELGSWLTWILAKGL